MGDDIRSGLPLSGKDYSAEPVYHVKPVDADGQRNAREQFEEKLKREQEEKQKEEAEKASMASPPPATGGIHEVQDGLILSERARTILALGTLAATEAPSAPPDAPTAAAPEKKEEAPPPPPVRHIDLKA